MLGLSPSAVAILAATCSGFYFLLHYSYKFMEILFQWDTWKSVKQFICTQKTDFNISGFVCCYFSDSLEDFLGIYNSGDKIDIAERIEADAYAFEKWPY